MKNNVILKTASLTPETTYVLRDKGTERPFSGEYNNNDTPGTYLCRQCGIALFRGNAKFISACGWPSFDEEIPHSVRVSVDADGRRMEIVCARCHAHLGHVFEGEGLTTKNIRHCVNSLSLDFVTDIKVSDTEEAIVGCGCFWGVEYYFKRLKGVLKTEVGYTGGSQPYPTYQEVCYGHTRHYEALRIVYDSSQIQYESIIKYFFEIHDPTQSNGQGPDLGQQYSSVIFFYNEEQYNIATKIISDLKNKGFAIVTQILPVSPFWKAEIYHQDYYNKNHKEPYCHHYVKRF